MDFAPPLDLCAFYFACFVVGTCDSPMIDELTDNEFDMKGLEQFKSLLMGE